METEVQPKLNDAFFTQAEKWNIGPFDAMLPGPMRLSTVLDGEIIKMAELEIGFLHRGIEKAFELQNWRAAIPYADRLDPEGAAFGELVFCLAVEDLMSIEIPERANCIRVIVSELSRISAHLSFMARLARAVQSEAVIHYFLRDREKILDLFERLSGARFALNFFRVGGVVSNVTDGVLERVVDLCDYIQTRLAEYNDVLSYNQAFLSRTVNVSPITMDQVYRYGITGPNARALGIRSDVRKDSPYSNYDKYEVKIPSLNSGRGTKGDVHSRYIFRLKEISESIKIIKQASDLISPGEFRDAGVDKIKCPPEGEAYSRIESSRGLMGCHVVSNNEEKLYRVQFRTPSMFCVDLIPELAKGARIEDLPVLLAGLDMSLAEVDK